MKSAWVAAMSGALLLSCSQNKNNGEVPMKDEAIQHELQVLQGKRIFFGHQSVGVDIMKGIKAYAEANGAALRFVAPGEAPSQGGFFADAKIGRNNFPAEKCDAFEADVKRLEKDSLDIAAMKFCYADIEPATDVAAVFDRYARTIDSLKQEYPRTTFVHITVPYTLRTSSWKLLVKKILGRQDKSESGNFQRNRFNAMLLQRYPHDPIFDLATVESTRPDGSRQSFEYEGQTTYSLVAQYTYDGGHLNELGRRIVAREFIRVLAQAAEKSGAKP